MISERDQMDEPLEGDEGEPTVGGKFPVGGVLLRTPIEELNPDPPITLEATATITNAVALMRERHIGCVLVMEGAQMVGIFSERDLVMKCVGVRDLDRTRLADVMTRSPETLTAKDSIAYAFNKMSVGGYRHVPIVDQFGHPEGIISVKDLIAFLVELIPAEILNLPPDPDKAIARTPAGA